MLPAGRNVHSIAKGRTEQKRRISSNARHQADIKDIKAKLALRYQMTGKTRSRTAIHGKGTRSHRKSESQKVNMHASHPPTLVQ